jgi:hypothetical protein
MDLYQATTSNLGQRKYISRTVDVREYVCTIHSHQAMVFRVFVAIGISLVIRDLGSDIESGGDSTRKVQNLII